MAKPDSAPSWLHDTVSALVYSFARAHSSPNQAETGPPYNDLTRFVLQQQARMPDYLRAPMRAATIGFDLLGCARAATRFHRQSPGTRARQIATWKNSSIGFQRDLMRYYESLTTFALCSRGMSGSAFSRASPASAPEGFPPEVIDNLDRELRCEIAVVGSGPGGAITACLLAEAGRDVLLVEDGPFQPLESCTPFSIDEMVQKYRNGGQTVALSKSKIAYVEGRCVGGGSEINSGLYHRTPPEILENWRKQFGTEGLDEADLMPHFEANERDLRVAVGSGPPAAASLKLRDGAARLGWKSLEVPRWYDEEDAHKPGGGRQSMTRTFIPRFLRAGGRVIPSTRIERLHCEGPKWTLRARRTGGVVSHIAAETVFVCGGAVQTPVLLLRSGIGRNIGNSLQVHPTIKVIAKFEDRVNTADMGVPVHQVKEFAPRLSFGCSISTPPHLALGLVDHPQFAKESRDLWQRMASYYAMITPEGKGTVRVLPRFSDPLVRYRLTENDRRHLADGVRKLSELLFEAGAVTLCPALANARPLLKRDDLKTLPALLPSASSNLMTIHLFSSCPMGEDKSRCATDSFGAVRGFKNLFIADASLLCTAPGVNPQGTIMALTRRNVMHFLSQ